MKTSFRTCVGWPALSVVASACAFVAQAQSVAVDPVVVTASRIAQPLSQTSVVVEVIDRQKIEASGASNITEFLDTVSGVNVNRLYGRMGVDASVDIGYLGESGAQNVLVLIDGQRLNSIDQAGVVFAQLPISSIERIEIRKANGGALYGDRAQGGVINIITRTDAGKSAGVTLGSYGQKQLDAYLGFRADDLRGSVSAMSAKSDGYRVNSQSRQDSAQLKLARSVAGGLLDFSLRAFEEDAHLPSYLTATKFRQDPRQIGASPDTANRKGTAYGLRYQQDLDNSAAWSVDLNVQDMQNKGYYDIKNQRVALIPEYRFQWAATQVLIGSELFNASANTANGKEVEQRSQSVYVQGIRPLSDRVTVDASARVQHVSSVFKAQAGADSTDSGDTKNGYGVGVRAKLTDATLLRVGALTGFRFANADELYYFDPSTFAQLAINPGVKPMSTREYFSELSHTYGPGKVAAHYRHIDAKDEIGYASACATINGSAADCNTNLYRTRRDVLSLNAEHGFGQGWTVRGAADFINTEITSGDNSGHRIPLTPNHVLRLSGEKKIQDITLTGVYHHRGGMLQSADPADSYPRIPSRSVIDLGLRARYSATVSYSFWIRNAFNKSYYDFAQYGGIYPADGRSLQLNVKAAF